MGELFASVAEERDGIATEPPVDVSAAGSAVPGQRTPVPRGSCDGKIIGMLHLEVSRHGFAELGMLVCRRWRGCGVGSVPSPLVRRLVPLARHAERVGRLFRERWPSHQGQAQEPAGHGRGHRRKPGHGRRRNQPRWVLAASSATFYRVPMTAGNTYTVAGNDTYGYSGNGGPVRLPGGSAAHTYARFQVESGRD
jgi:hypothetical protein